MSDSRGAVRNGREPAQPPPALEISRTSKTFAAYRVLRDVDLSIAHGEIRALVGENGSGKSTLVKILAGYHTPDPGGGPIMVVGRTIAPHRAGEAVEAGLRFVHQDLALVDPLSTVENLGLGLGYGCQPGRPIRWGRRRQQAQRALGELGYTFDVERPVASLRASERTAVAIVRALARQGHPPKVLVLDEPTASLPGREVERLFELIQRVRDSGVAILFISHHLNEVMDLADTVTVLRNGAVVDTRAVSEVTEQGLIALLVGHEVERARRVPAVGTATPVLATTGLSGSGLHRIDLEVAAGEIVGIAGITGSGREALAPLLFGGSPREGLVTVAGTPLKGSRPDLSIAAGMALIPADRARNAVIHGFSVAENLSVARLGDFARLRTLRKRRESSEVLSSMRKLDVRPLEPSMPYHLLSGGNAQKVILARWLRLKPRVLLLDEPTHGVDVGAREAIHRQVEDAAADGCAVLVCSTDNEELAGICSRVIVLVRGRVAAELHSPIEIDEITAASLASGEDSHEFGA